MFLSLLPFPSPSLRLLFEKKQLADVVVVVVVDAVVESHLFASLQYGILFKGHPY